MSFTIQPGFIIPPLTAGGVAYGTGTNAFMTAAGIAGQALVSTGSGAPNWVTSVPSTQALAGGNTGDLAYQSAPNTTAFLPVTTGAIVYGGATLPAYSAVGTAGQPLLSNGTSAPTFGTLGVANGGTGATSAATARTNLVAQETLVSGTNIKTVGGQSLLGSGNISVGSGTVTTVSGQGTVQGLTLTGSVTTSGFLTLGGSLSAVSLTSQVSGTLPTGNGGTGVTTGPFGMTLIASGSTASVASLSLSCSGWESSYKYLYIVWLGTMVAPGGAFYIKMSVNNRTTSGDYERTYVNATNTVSTANSDIIENTKSTTSNAEPNGVFGVMFWNSVTGRMCWDLTFIRGGYTIGMQNSAAAGVATSIQFRNSGVSDYLNATAYIYGVK